MKAKYTITLEDDSIHEKEFDLSTNFLILGIQELSLQIDKESEWFFTPWKTCEIKLEKTTGQSNSERN